MYVKPLHFRRTTYLPLQTSLPPAEQARRYNGHLDLIFFAVRPSIDSQSIEMKTLLALALLAAAASSADAEVVGSITLATTQEVTTAQFDLAQKKSK